MPVVILLIFLATPAVGDTFEELRNQVLYWCIEYKNKIYNQVRALFGVRD